MKRKHREDSYVASRWKEGGKVYGTYYLGKPVYKYFDCSPNGIIGVADCDIPEPPSIKDPTVIYWSIIDTNV